MGRIMDEQDCVRKRTDPGNPDISFSFEESIPPLLQEGPREAQKTSDSFLPEVYSFSSIMITSFYVPTNSWCCLLAATVC